MRPKLKLELSSADKVIEAICLIIIIVLWMGTIFSYSNLPNEIPTHFNAAGEADDFSDKSSIFFLLLLATIIYVGITILNQHPHLYNYLSPVTADNARQLYTTATRVIRMIKLATVLILSGIVYMTIRTAADPNSGLGSWFLPTAIALLLVPNIFYFIKSSKS